MQLVLGEENSKSLNFGAASVNTCNNSLINSIIIIWHQCFSNLFLASTHNPLRNPQPKFLSLDQISFLSYSTGSFVATLTLLIFRILPDFVMASSGNKNINAKLVSTLTRSFLPNVLQPF